MIDLTDANNINLTRGAFICDVEINMMEYT